MIAVTANFQGMGKEFEASTKLKMSASSGAKGISPTLISSLEIPSMPWAFLGYIFLIFSMVLDATVGRKQAIWLSVLNGTSTSSMEAMMQEVPLKRNSACSILSAVTFLSLRQRGMTPQDVEFLVNWRALKMLSSDGSLGNFHHVFEYSNGVPKECVTLPITLKGLRGPGKYHPFSSVIMCINDRISKVLIHHQGLILCKFAFKTFPNLSWMSSRPVISAWT